jgi:PAS domain S-box-containing protein
MLGDTRKNSSPLPFRLKGPLRSSDRPTRLLLKKGKGARMRRNKLPEWDKMRDLLAKASAHANLKQQKETLEQISKQLSVLEQASLEEPQKTEEPKPKTEADREAVLTTLFEYSPLPYLFFGTAGIIDCNRAAVKILEGKNKQDILSRHPAAFSPEIQPDGILSSEKSKEMDRRARLAGFHTFEWTHRTLNGRDFPVEVTLAPVAIGDETVLLTVWRDLTEVKANQARLIIRKNFRPWGKSRRESPTRSTTPWR